MRRRPYPNKQGYVLPLVFLVSIFSTFGCAGPPVRPPTAERDAKGITSVTHHALKDIRVVDLEVHLELAPSETRDVYYSAFKSTDPLRLVLDLPNTTNETVPSTLAVENEIVGKIETLTLGDESRPFTRVEISLNQDTGYFVDQAERQLSVTFFTHQQEMEAAAAQGEPVVLPEVEVSPPETKNVKGADTSQPPAQDSRVRSPIVEKEPLPPASKILAIEPVAMEEGFDVHIIGNGRFDKYDVFLLYEPPRLVVDLIDLKSTEVKEAVNLNLPWAKSARVGKHPKKVRVVFDLKFTPLRELPFKLTFEENRLVVSLVSDGQT